MKQKPSDIQIPNLTIAIICSPDETGLQFQMARTYIGKDHRYIHHDRGAKIVSRDVQFAFLIGSRQFHDLTIEERIAHAEIAFANNPGMLLTRTSPGREMALWIQQRNTVLQRNLWPILSEVAPDLVRLLGLEQLPSPH